MRAKLAAALLVTAITGCTTNPDGSHGPVGSFIWLETAPMESRVKFFTRLCESYGYERDTSEMRDCVAEEARRARADLHALNRSLYMD